MIIKELRRFDRCPLLVIANETNIPEAVGGILALSDLLVVSGESISMVSEAVSSAKKTIVFSPTGQYTNHPSTKYDRFVLDLSQERYLLACSIKDISVALDQALGQKISTKTMDDHQTIIQAIEGIL
jgi:mitochondrial fission protein ELM1